MSDTRDIVERLHPCPFCGSEAGYSLSEGSTYRWWDVHCKGCGRMVDECASDRRTQLGTKLPDRWPAADEAWNDAAAYSAALRAAPPVVPQGWRLETGVGGFGEKGERWVCVRHLESQCGQDFYEDRDPLIFGFLSALAAAPHPAQEGR